jgi:transposase
MRALGVYLVAAQHLPYQRAAQLLADWLGAPLSAGTLVEFVKGAAAELDEFLDLVHEQITCSPVVHFDETGARVAGRGRWLHCASTETLTFYALHDRRGTEGIDHAGVMPHFQGIAVHDGWPQYRTYTQATHALCNAHHLRELLSVIEQHTDGQRSWASHMDALLRALHEGGQGRQSGRRRLVGPGGSGLLPGRLRADHRAWPPTESAADRPHRQARSDRSQRASESPAPPR